MSKGNEDSENATESNRLTERIPALIASGDFKQITLWKEFHIKMSDIKTVD